MEHLRKEQAIAWTRVLSELEELSLSKYTELNVRDRRMYVAIATLVELEISRLLDTKE